MLARLKNPDVAALATMALALAAEVVVYLASDASLLAKLPPWLGPVLLAVAAVFRLRSGGVITGASGTPSSPDAAIPTSVDNDVTPVIDDPHQLLNRREVDRS